MNNINTPKAFLELASGFTALPYLANLSDVLIKAETPFRRRITEWEIDKGVDALKDSIHSRMTLSKDYANDRQRETDKNIISAMAENAKIWTKEFLRARGLLVTNGLEQQGKFLPESLIQPL